MNAIRTSGNDASAENGRVFEVLHDTQLIYSDTADGVLEALIDGYADQQEEPVRLQSRIVYAAHAQKGVQVLLNAGEPFDLATPNEAEILLASQTAPPRTEKWSCPVPLVLVSHFYEPVGEYPRPSTEPPGQIWWIDPSTPLSLLITLHGVRWLDLRAASIPAAGTVTHYLPSGENGSAGYHWRSYS